MTVLKVVAGFVLGGVLAILMPTLTVAMALVLGGVLLWARLRGEDMGQLTPVAGGFLAAVAAYVLLAIGYAVF